MPIMSQRPKSFYEEEIEVKPSTELIPDEYEHCQDSSMNMVIHTFCSNDDNDKENVNKFLDTLKNLGYVVNDANKHCLETEDFCKIIDNICAECTADHTGLILVFCGNVKNSALEIFDGTKENTVKIQDIWIKFTSHECLQLKNKPKIFIFSLTSPMSVATDGTRYFSGFEKQYDTPAEADILVAYSKSNGQRNDFLELLCDNIESYGETENIVSLVSFSSACSSDTMTLSTLTRKFYFTSSLLRGNQQILEKNSFEIQKHLQELHEKLEKKRDVKKDTRKSFLKSFRLGRSKSKTVTDQPDNTNPSKQTPPRVASSTPGASSTNPVRRQSGLSDGRRPSNKKPWKP